MAGYFSDILILCSISLIEMVSSSPFFPTSLSSEVPYSFKVFVCIVRRKTPAHFNPGLRNYSRPALSLDFLL